MRLLQVSGRTRAGVTLLELILVLAVMAVATALATISFRPPPSGVAADAIWARVQELRLHAVRSGRPTTAIFQTDSGARALTAYPDSRVISELTTSLDYLTGRRHDER